MLSLRSSKVSWYAMLSILISFVPCSDRNRWSGTSAGSEFARGPVNEFTLCRLSEAAERCERCLDSEIDLSNDFLFFIADLRGAAGVEGLLLTLAVVVEDAVRPSFLRGGAGVGY